MLPGILSIFKLQSMLSFTEYASEKRILELLIKERVKVALKNKLKDVSPIVITHKHTRGQKMTVQEQIFLLMPPRDSWLRPQKKDRIQDNDEKKSNKQILAKSISLTIKKHRKAYEEHPYLRRLDKFITLLREEIADNNKLEFTSLKITGKKKKTKDGVIVLRPICVFDSLREKLLVALASKYLSEAFDQLLHEEILSYRPLRKYHNSNIPVLTDRDNAIENIQDYLKRHRQRSIYVAECDIQKYFDTINHDVIRDCFAKFAEKAQKLYPGFEYGCVKRILDAYLDSYSFYKNVIAENEMLSQCSTPKMYESPDEGLFIERGCYTKDDFNESIDRIGIPQGGALSSIISNVVLSTIDSESLLYKDDTNRFFCRYGDDIILMHTSKEECGRLIRQYCNALTKRKLLYHDFVSVANPKLRKPDGSTRPALWDQKSRSPFLWGRCDGEKEQVDWIGFLGYEIRYTGEVRLRRSSLNEKFKSIKRKYYTGAKSLIAKGEFKKDIDKEILNRIERFKTEGVVTAKSLNCNKYCMTQILKLDRYAGKLLYRLLYKIACRNNLTNEELLYWWKKAKEYGCINYRLTYKQIIK